MNEQQGSYLKGIGIGLVIGFGMGFLVTILLMSL